MHSTCNRDKRGQYLHRAQNLNIMKKTLVLDSSYMPRSIIASTRAFVIVYKGNAKVVSEYDETFKLVTPTVKIRKPSIIRVPNYINVHFHKVPLSRENIYKRDNFTCVYCGSQNKKKFTLDHVIPQSKGGPNTWDNLVTACWGCNNEKADLSLKEWNKSIPEPKRPHYLMLLKQVQNIPKSWESYLLF